MSDKPIMTKDSGAVVHDNQHSETNGARGPVLIQDNYLLEKLARFNRERIPERVVHATATGAYGTFECTSDEVSKWTKMCVFAAKGKKTDVFGRWSTVARSKGSVDSVRDPRGFALKFYTEDGNWDLVGNNTPIFFIRDGIKFPDFIHSQKYDPFTNKQEPNNVWDFFANSPEATHQFVWLFGPRGMPASFANMDGFGSHTFQWVNAEGKRVWVKFHFKTDQGIAGNDPEEQKCLPAEALQTEFYDRLERGDHPSWTLKVQVMPDEDAQDYRFNPFDLTKVWPYEDYPLIEVGKLTMHTPPDNYFAEVEQSAFDPNHFIPGIGSSPDRMLQARLFAYGDAARYRLGINHFHIPVNQPKGVKGGARNYGRDGFMRTGDNGGRSVNYEPNSRGGPVERGDARATGYDSSGFSSTYEPVKHELDDDYIQAGWLYETMSDADKDHLVDAVAGDLGQVTLPGVIEKSLGHFRRANAEMADRIQKKIQEME